MQTFGISFFVLLLHTVGFLYTINSLSARIGLNENGQL